LPTSSRRSYQQYYSDVTIAELVARNDLHGGETRDPSLAPVIVVLR
jgi:hypothetical protein